ncbi:hypothetical protein NQ315_015433 [Exocentrus adspersus]|uniref:snRNA-activating protein complex subunit 3 n=1 Tax=Exocentrus adspersus TaxID=1586481 RepID=A0AAV8VM14_9CUCU|nr:hypothetical protein NQ315_015433 [Exocentrus adspersus]
MEAIYEPKSFKASEHIAIEDYFKSYSELCQFADALPESVCLDQSDYLSKIGKLMNINISETELENLDRICGINALTLRDEPNYLPMEVPKNLHTRSKLEKMYPTNSSARMLNVVTYSGVLKRKFNYASDFKIGSKRFIKTGTVSSNRSVLCDMKPGTNFIYSIIVYRPYYINFNQKNSGERLRFAFEIEALGTNTLAEVADQICCVFNEGLFKEVEDTNVDLKPFMNAKAFYPSQCIYIDGVLYNDFRSPDAIDYSAKIIEWASEKNIGKFKSELMEKASLSCRTLLSTLQPRLGYPYVYMHQGSCEHVFTFSDARLLQPCDCLHSKKYPRMVSISRVYNILCFICNVMNAQWAVLECSKFPHEKVFLCTECCNSYLYVDGKKVTSFKLYPYYDQEMLTRHLQDVNVE